MRWLTISVLSVLAAAATAPAVYAQSVGWAGQPLAAVNTAAKSGDKAAQLELGKRYESGSGGASCDIGKAKKWYARAARTTGGAALAYSAPVGKERYGRMVDVGGSRVVTGLPAAASRLDDLRARSGVLPVSCQNAGGEQ